MAEINVPMVAFHDSRHTSMSIETVDGQTRFMPLDTIRGTVSWRSDADPRKLELRLFWFTRGKGEQDVAVVDKIALEPALGRQDFSFTLPEQPYSFSGRLVSLAWALELVSEEPDETCRFEFVLSPTGQEILI